MFTRILAQERREARLEPEPRARRLHRALRGCNVDARCVELGLHAALHLELAGTSDHA